MDYETSYCITSFLLTIYLSHGSRKHKFSEIMKTLKTLKNGRLLYKLAPVLLLIGISLTSNAQDKLSSNFANDLVKDGFIGYYIIGGILAFGIIGYLIISLVRKHENTKDSNQHLHKHHHHRHHHHHRVIKKSA